MSIARIRNAVVCFAQSLVICAVLVYGPTLAFTQTPDSSSEKAKEAKPVSGTSPSSDPSSEDQQQPSTSSVICGPAHPGTMP